MNSEPAPKRELVVVTYPNPAYIEVYFASRDAEEWLSKNLKFFLSHDTNRYSYFLMLSPLYDRQEIIDYLESYNNVDLDKTENG